MELLQRGADLHGRVGGPGGVTGGTGDHHRSPLLVHRTGRHPKRTVRGKYRDRLAPGIYWSRRGGTLVRGDGSITAHHPDDQHERGQPAVSPVARSSRHDNLRGTSQGKLTKAKRKIKNY
jgi:hypothetical protein